MFVLAAIGAKALYLLFLWLLSAAVAAWLSDRKGYGERVGLTFGLILTFVGLILVVLLPARPGSMWKREGPLPRRRRHVADSETSGAAVTGSAGPESAGPGSAGPESARPESAGPESAGPESAGPESAGPESRQG